MRFPRTSLPSRGTAPALLLAACLPAACRRTGPGPADDPPEGPAWFADATAEVGLDFTHEAGPVGRYFMPQIMGSGVALLDFDNDGLLDVYLVQNGGPGSSARNRLFRNRGRGPEGRWLGFEDVPVASGLAARHSPGLGVVCADFDGDGWPDILVANDSSANHLRVNQLGKSGRKDREEPFFKKAVLRGLAYNALGNAQANMGVALGDVDGDGLLDLFITHLTEETQTLWRQGPRGLFRDRTADAGLSAPRWRGTGFGTALTDFDHDGAPDLAAVNGRVSRGPAADVPGLGPFWSRYAERNQLFANDGRGHFRDVSTSDPAFCGTPNVARGLAWGVLNNKAGSVDLVVTTVAGPARLYRNVAPRRGHWLPVRALDPSWKRDAYGARVTVTAGKRRWVGLVNPGQSYLSSGDPRVHFGLGSAARADEVRVDWPDGLAEVFAATLADRLITLSRGQGRKVRP